MERKDEKGFCCEICMMVMERGRVPRMLPCGHSFCSDCLKKRRERESNLRCSNCGEVFEGEFVESFEVNELIPKMVDILLSSHILLVSDRPGFFFSLSLSPFLCRLSLSLFLFL